MCTVKYQVQSGIHPVLKRLDLVINNGVKYKLSSSSHTSLNSLKSPVSVRHGENDILSISLLPQAFKKRLMTSAVVETFGGDGGEKDRLCNICFSLKVSIISKEHTLDLCHGIGRD